MTETSFWFLKIISPNQLKAYLKHLKMQKNAFYRTFFATKSDWFHTRKLKYDLTKQQGQSKLKDNLQIIHFDNLH